MFRMDEQVLNSYLQRFQMIFCQRIFRFKISMLKYSKHYPTSMSYSHCSGLMKTAWYSLMQIGQIVIKPWNFLWFEPIWYDEKFACSKLRQTGFFYSFFIFHLLKKMYLMVWLSLFSKVQKNEEKSLWQINLSIVQIYLHHSDLSLLFQTLFTIFNCFCFILYVSILAG